MGSLFGRKRKKGVLDREGHVGNYGKVNVELRTPRAVAGLKHGQLHPRVQASPAGSAFLHVPLDGSSFLRPRSLPCWDGHVLSPQFASLCQHPPLPLSDPAAVSLKSPSGALP